MAYHRLKRSFTSGELSEVLSARTDLERYNNGCKKLRNAYNMSQGPAVRRSGLKFIYDISSLIADMNGIKAVDIIPFIFSEEDAYSIIVITDNDNLTRFFFGYKDTLIAEDLDPNAIYFVETNIGLVAGEFSHTQSGDVLFIAQRDVAPTQLTRTGHADWNIDFITFDPWPTDVDDNPEWGEGDWPGKVSLYEQRGVWASTVTRTNTLWFTEAGNLYSFDKKTGTGGIIVASDALTFTLASGTQNKISWLLSHNRLLIGTLGDEWAMSGAGFQPLTFESVVARRQTSKGAEAIPPILVGSSTIFLERLGRSVYQFVYDYNIDSYYATDLSILAPQFTENNSIVNWDIQEVPNSIIWACRDDGVLLGFTYQVEHQVQGWHLHTTDGKFLAVGCVPNEDTRETDATFLITREIEGVEKLYYEKFVPEFHSDDVKDAYFLDSAQEYNDPDNPEQTFTSLAHLEGKTVNILTDGAVHPPQVVVDGTINLYKPYGRVVVGLPYTTTIIPYVPDVEGATGTTIGKTQRVTNVDVMLYKSLGMLIGKDEDSMEVVPFRKPQDPTGTGIPLYTGVRKIMFPEGYDNETNIVIQQKQPLPLTVVGTVDEIEVGER